MTADVGTGSRLERTSLVDQAVEQLRNEIVSGALAPGTQLSEGKISKTFGIARPTVREVLLSLLNEGLVQRQGRGLPLAVTRIDREQVFDIYTARVHLELAGARSFAGASPLARQAVDSSVDQLEQATIAGDRLEQQRLDTQCHTTVVALTGSQRLVAAHLQVLRESRLASLTAGSVDQHTAVANHRQFVVLLRQGELEKASQQLEERMRVARDRVLAKLSE